jgi:hypothetical protein
VNMSNGKQDHDPKFGDLDETDAAGNTIINDSFSSYTAPEGALARRGKARDFGATVDIYLGVPFDS